MANKNKLKTNFTIRKLIIFGVLVALSLITLFFSKTFEKWIGINSAFYKPANAASYTVHFVDVGQGDCTIFEFPNGDIMIVDSGKGKSESAVKNYLETIIFADRDNKTITYLVATHSDEDHIGNMKFILDNYDVKNVYRPVILSKSETTSTGKGVCTTNVYDNFIKAAEAEPDCNIHLIENGIGETFAQYAFWFYGPMQSSYSDVNDYCPFLFVESNGKVTLITGDASSAVEEEIITANSGSLINKVDLYQCGHHGSKTSTSDLLLSTIEIKTCVISVGKDNTYGHPNAETLAKLHAKSINVLITKDVGSVIYAYDEAGDAVAVATGNISVFDSVRWWMVVLVFDGVLGIVIFSIRIKIIKRL